MCYLPCRFHFSALGHPSVTICNPFTLMGSKLTFMWTLGVLRGKYVIKIVDFSQQLGPTWCLQGWLIFVGQSTTGPLFIVVTANILVFFLVLCVRVVNCLKMEILLHALLLTFLEFFFFIFRFWDWSFQKPKSIIYFLDWSY